MQTLFNTEQQKTFLTQALNATYKILPLYENNNAYLDEYLESLIEFELEGGQQMLSGYPADVWLVRSVNTLSSLKDALVSSKGLTQPIVKREVFKVIKIIQKELDSLEKGELNV